MINDHLIKLKLLTFTLMFSALFLAESKAQSDPTDTPTSVKETNIICYAAKNKWVCAPADEKEKAQEKAMKLALGKSETSSLTNPSSQPVEIKTIAPNNISQQVQVLEDPIQTAINDFTPRQDAPPPTEQAEPIKSAEQTAETIVNTAEPKANSNSATQQRLAPAKVTTQSTSTSVKNASGDFTQWQAQHAEQWTFQVIGTSNRHHLDGFMLKHGLEQTNHSIVKTQANGADWWVVLSGLYSSRNDALSQRDTLPAELSGNAWVRQIKTIVGQAD